jgi:hypothetical protein
MLSKEELRSLDTKDLKDAKTDAPDSAKSAVNANNSFRADPKNRFSDPPAPPPSQPLPEKPDVPSLKRGTTERPKSGSFQNTSPIKTDSVGQILQLTDELQTAKKQIEFQSAKLRDLEETLNREREARQFAEDMAKQLEDARASSIPNGAAKQGGESVLEAAFEPPTEAGISVSSNEMDDALLADDDDKTMIIPVEEEEVAKPSPAASSSDDITKYRFEMIMAEMRELKLQVDTYKQRAEKAEVERDADRKTLAEMVMAIRQRDEEAAMRSAELAVLKARSKISTATPTKHAQPSILETGAFASATAMIGGAADAKRRSGGALSRDYIAEGMASGPDDEAIDLVSPGGGAPTFSRANTLKPLTPPDSPASSVGKLSPVQEKAVMQQLPYASMIGVVLLGMGLMAYLNGWQPQPRLDR